MTRAALVNCRTNVLIMVGQLFLPQKGRDLGMCIHGRGQGSFRPKADICPSRVWSIAGKVQESADLHRCKPCPPEHCLVAA